jgi:hypothetical protein
MNFKRNTAMSYFKNSIIAAAGSILIFSSCTKTIKNLEANPNNPTSVPPSLVMGAVLTDISGTITNTSATGLTAATAIGNLGGIASWDAVHRWNQYYCTNYNYYVVNNYNWQNGPFDSYQVLKNVGKMEQEAITRSEPAVNPYTAIGKFARAWYFYNMTSLMGDIPQTEALQGLSNPTPAYTSQKQVFQYILNVLDSANTEFASLIASGDATIQNNSQEIYYGGDLSKWQKLVNSFKLRVLISLSKRASSDPDLNIPAQFANIFNNQTKYPIFGGQTDDFQFIYNATSNQYYFSPGVYGSIATRYNMGNVYVSALTGLNDPRIFVTAEPATFRTDSLGFAPTSFDAFAGSSTGEDLSPMGIEATKGFYSFINRKRYFSTYLGEPDVLVGYREMCFNIAEAANLGWIGDNPESWYEKGIQESFKFYGIDPGGSSFTAYFQSRKTSALGNYDTYTINYDFNTYYNQPAVKYAGGSTGINQIILQKYLAMFQNSGWEAYYNWRRTGVPTFQTGTGVGNSGVIPKRWTYPVTEQSVNKANWQAALANQQFTADDLNQTMWLVK